MSAEYSPIMGSIIFLVALAGSSLNILVLRFTKKAKAFQSCFGSLIRFEAGSALVYNSIFGLYVAPTLIFTILPLQEKAVSARFGHLTVLSHDVCLLTHLTISINRFIAAWLSSKYTKVFTAKRTSIYCVLIVVVAFLITLFHFFQPCWIFFAFNQPEFMYDINETCGRVVGKYVQFPRNLAVMCVCTLLNIATYAKIRVINHGTRQTLAATTEQRRRHKLELALISQVCVQAAVYIIQFFTYFIIAPLVDPSHIWIVFFLTTFAWQMVHVTDGLAVFAFNRELLSLILVRIRLNSTPTISVSSRPISTSMKL